MQGLRFIESGATDEERNQLLTYRALVRVLLERGPYLLDYEQIEELHSDEQEWGVEVTLRSEYQRYGVRARRRNAPATIEGTVDG